MNGVCGTTRLVGCYHLGPEVIPAPSTFSLPLTPGDDHIILGTDSLWKHVSRETAVRVVSQPQQTPGSAARVLRDLAVGCGSRNDISVIVIRLTMGAGLGESTVHPEESVTSERDRDQSYEEDVEFTNIDDLLSDTEDGMELGQESTWNGVRTRKKALAPMPPVVASVDIDQMILSAVSSPPSSHFTPEMKSTNIDDILSSPPHHLPAAHPHQPHQPPTAHQQHHPTEQRETEINGGAVSGGERKGKRITRVGSPGSPPTSPVYPAQTIPRDAAGSRSKGRDSAPPLPPSQAINYEQFKDSFEVTQSAPIIPANQPVDAETTPTVGVVGGRSNGVVGRQSMVDKVGFGGSLQRERDKRGGGKGKRDVGGRGLRGHLTRQEVEGGVAEANMEGYLAQLNQTMTDLDSDPTLWNGTETRPRNGAGLQKRLSYVETSYQQLTNNVYSEGAVSGLHHNDDEPHHW